MVLTIFFVVFFLTILIGVPVSFSLGLASVAALCLWQQASLLIIANNVTSIMGSFPLMAVPFFLLAGDLMGVGGILNRLIDFSNILVGRFRGGLAHVTTVSEMFFSGITGAAAADTAAIGSVLIPAMVKEGYDLHFSAAVTSASCTLGPIIPPSITMVIYALIAGNISIAGLFAMGFIPGAITGLGFMGISYLISRKRNYPVHKVPITFWGFFRLLWSASYALIMPVFILGTILLGMCTATEAGAIACIYAIFIGFFVTKKLTFKQLNRLTLRAGIITSSILILLGVGNVAGWFFTVHQVAQKIGDFIQALAPGPIAFFFITVFILLIIGCLLDIGAGMILFLPILLPISAELGIHPYHFAFVFIYALIIGLITPPVGIILFVCVGLNKDITMEKLVQALPPYLLIMLAVLILAIFFPEMELIVPRLLGLVN